MNSGKAADYVWPKKLFFSSFFGLNLSKSKCIIRRCLTFHGNATMILTQVSNGIIGKACLARNLEVTFSILSSALFFWARAHVKLPISPDA